MDPPLGALGQRDDRVAEQAGTGLDHRGRLGVAADGQPRRRPDRLGDRKVDARPTRRCRGVCVYTLAATHVLGDLQGYLGDDAVDDIVDERVLDTREP